jgi:uncharacterized protein YbcV (DUF1398 family)
LKEEEAMRQEPSDSTRAVIERCAAASHAGTMHFGQVVAALTEAGVEAYQADYRARAITYYLPSGGTHAVALDAPGEAVAPAFAAEDVRAAIRAAQKGEVMYPEFVQRTARAGCAGYIVFISGRHVLYFGRHGEQHVEPFPRVA